MNGRTVIKEIAQVIRGVSFDKGEAMGVHGDGCLPVLRAGNIDQELITDRDLIWVPQKRIAAEQRLKPGDIAICMSSGSPKIVGKTALLRSAWDGSVGAFCAIVRPQADRVLPEYLAFFMQSEQFRTWTRQSSGANIKNIRKSELEDFQLTLPTIEEQRRIVDLLSRAEGIVRLRREAQKKAAEIIPALFLDMFGDPATNPKGWPIRPIGDIADIIVPTRDKPKSFSGNIPWITIPDLGFFYTKIARNLLTHEEAQEVGNRLMPQGTVLLSCAGSLGKVSVIEVAAYVNQQLYGLIPRNDVLVAEFLAISLRLKSESFYKQLAGTSTLGFFSKAKALSIEIQAPPFALQREYVSHLKRILEICLQQDNALRGAKTTFNSLLSKVFLPGIKDGRREGSAAELAHVV